jgi:3-phosphoshikimate 1-carboxyvinyltransferase
MGARITSGSQLARGVAAAPGRSRRIDVDCNHIPDAAMTLAVMALYADGRRA